MYLKKFDFSRVTVEDVDSYIESMYEETTEAKLKGSISILFLCFHHENMEYMLQHNQLMGTISRTLRDDFKKNLELSLYLLNVFYAYSNFSQFHPYLLQNQVGDTCMKIIEYEVLRYKKRVREFQKLRETFEKEQNNREADLKELQKTYVKEERKLSSTIRKQEKVLFVAFHILLNMAEDFQIERKMVRIKITGLLVAMIERNNPDLLFIILTFLKKLSIFGENKNEMKEFNIVEKVNRFVPCNNQLLTQLSLRLLFNLSFDPEVRDQMVKASMIPKMVELLKIPPFRSFLLKILYHLSLDDKAKTNFTYTECIPLVYQLIIHFPDAIVGKELVALAINLTTNSRNAEMMSGEEGSHLEELIKRALKFKDVLLIRVVRNIAQFGPNTNLDIFESYMVDLIRLTQEDSENTDLLVEVMGTLVYVTTERWAEVLAETNFIEFLHNNLVNGYAEDDVMLETIMLIGTICRNDECAEKIASSYLIGQLHSLLGAKQEDDEIVQQILYTYLKMLMFKVTRDIVLHQTQIVSIVLELLNDKNPNIR